MSATDPSQSSPQTSGKAKMSKLAIAGWVLSVLPSLGLVLGGIMMLSDPEAAAKGNPNMGFPPEPARTLGVIVILSVALYLFPRTSVLGAILLTGYLGGAVALHVRVHEPFFAAVIFGIVIWAGLVMRDTKVRAVLPLRE